MADGAAPGRQLGHRVRHARLRAFVGRDDELGAVEAALRGDDGAASVFLVHGPGGIGKTMLLRAVADRARRRGRPVVEVDGRAAGQSTAAFETAAGPARDADRAVLLVDAFEYCQWLEAWLRDRFLTTLPADTVVVLAGREQPDLEWSVDPGWAPMVRTVALRPLDPAAAAALLTAHGLAPGRHDAVLRFAAGNPLVLSLAAAVPAEDAASWTPSVEVLPTLVTRLVGDVPSAAHRLALDVAARAFTTDESLLRAALPDHDASALFSWLSTLPFVEQDTAGLHPHDAVRETLIADSTRRGGTEDDALRTRLTAELIRRVRTAAEPAAMPAMADLAFAHRDAPRVAHLYTWDRRSRLEPEPLRPDDLPFALDLLRRNEGDESAGIARYWYERQPHSFALYRAVDSGDPAAVAARLVLTAPVPDDIDADPVVAAAWRHCRRTDPVPDGQHIAVRRFTTDAASNLASWQSLAAICRSTGLSYAFVVHRDAARWRTWVGDTTHEIEEKPVVDGHAHALFVNDWRYLTFEQYWEHAVGGDRATSTTVVSDLSRQDFDEAVRQALTLWRHRDGLSGSPLGATALVPTPADDVDPTLRAAVRQALEGMRADQRDLRGHDAVVATYLGAPTTQQAAARRLGVPFSSYRRHLKHGVDTLCERLWRATRDGARRSTPHPVHDEASARR